MRGDQIVDGWIEPDPGRREPQGSNWPLITWVVVMGPLVFLFALSVLFS